MYYRLNENYVLRGWIKQNAVLVRRPRNQTYPLKAEEFNLLTLCDGETDFDDIPLSPEQQDLLNLYIRRKAVTELNSPVPLEEDQVYRFYPNRFVSSVFWSVTGRCNYRCRHCYMDAPNGALGELSYEEAIDLIDQMADCGVLTVDITGGEPFVRKDIWRLIDRIVSHRMTIGVVYTNGWLLNERVLDQFEQRNLKPQISISFDGLGWHDWMRGVNGAEEAALKALLLCKKRGFPMDVELCVHRGNLPVLRETVNRLAEIGVTQLRFGNVSQTELWKCHSEGNDLSFREYVEAVLDYIPYFFEDGMRQDLLIGGIIDLHRGNPKYKVIAEKHSGDDDCLDCNLCGAVRYSSYITPEGRLSSLHAYDGMQRASAVCKDSGHGVAERIKRQLLYAVCR